MDTNKSKNILARYRYFSAIEKTRKKIGNKALKTQGILGKEENSLCSETESCLLVTGKHTRQKQIPEQGLTGVPKWPCKPERVPIKAAIPQIKDSNPRIARVL